MKNILEVENPVNATAEIIGIKYWLVTSGRLRHWGYNTYVFQSKIYFSISKKTLSKCKGF